MLMLSASRQPVPLELDLSRVGNIHGEPPNASPFLSFQGDLAEIVFHEVSTYVGEIGGHFSGDMGTVDEHLYSSLTQRMLSKTRRSSEQGHLSPPERYFSCCEPLTDRFHIAVLYTRRLTQLHMLQHSSVLVHVPSVSSIPGQRRSVAPPLVKIHAKGFRYRRN